MAIYIRLDQVEQNISECRERLTESITDGEFFAGFDTCTDVATCANEGTIWHKGTPATEEDVLVAMCDGSIHIGSHSFAWFYKCGVQMNDEAVEYWAYLPDFPKQSDIV